MTQLTNHYLVLIRHDDGQREEYIEVNATTPEEACVKAELEMMIPRFWHGIEAVIV